MTKNNENNATAGVSLITQSNILMNMSIAGPPVRPMAMWSGVEVGSSAAFRVWR
ncbi:MAG: hypothetical protein OQJ87_09505 [Rhodospirillales bacterium]|nr:hypothetical protein [Rhodospirillales bacterium]MCW9002941.1 hypothetical protein [Rhodospirillales bacterium]MCW9038920.1 hypothetical protein [Rhodospirillales bacterium]